MDNSEIYYHHGFAEPSALLGCDANLMLGGSVSSCATYKVKTSKFTVGRGIYSSVTLYVPCAAHPVLTLATPLMQRLLAVLIYHVCVGLSPQKTRLFVA